MAAASARARIYVLAGVNGAGKSSIAGAAIRAFGGDYYNPDEAATRLQSVNAGLSRPEANSVAWHQGRRLLERAITQRLDFAFESTLGASTIPRLLAEAASTGIEIHVWYIGLESPELHIARVRARVSSGGHDIPESDIRRRYEHSRINLIQLLSKLKTLRVYDNSVQADPTAGLAPAAPLVLHVREAKIINRSDLARAPQWAKPIVAAAMKLERR